MVPDATGLVISSGCRLSMEEMGSTTVETLVGLEVPECFSWSKGGVMEMERTGLLVVLLLAVVVVVVEKVTELGSKECAGLVSN